VSEETLETQTEATPPPPFPGKLLAAAREGKGLSVADVARSLRLSVRQIEAIEGDDFDKLPGKTFLRGFVRNYAKLLQLDPEPLLLSSRLAVEQPQPQAISVPPGQVEFSVSRSQRTFSGKHVRSWLKYLPVTVFILGLLGWAAFALIQGSSSSTVMVKPAGDGAAVSLALPPIQSPALEEQHPAGLAESAVAPVAQANREEASSPPSVPPTSAANPETTALSQGGAKIKLSFTGESWIDLRDKSGRTIYKQTGQAGNEQIISGASPFTLTVGKAVNVKVFYNDRPIDLAPYTNGDVARLTLN
jgi:cytoskeleton protein RodZ